MAKPELGAKQLCPNCGAKFYDLTKRPAVCPKCQTAFDPEEVVKTRSRRRGAGPADYEDEETPKPVEQENDGFEDEVDETPEIDQAIEDEVIEPDEEAEGDTAGASKPAPAEDLGVDFAVDDEDVEGAAEDEDDVFLEDEDEDGFSEDDIDGLPGEDEERD